MSAPAPVAATRPGPSVRFRSLGYLSQLRYLVVSLRYREAAAVARRLADHLDAHADHVEPDTTVTW